jgi:TIR domain
MPDMPVECTEYAYAYTPEARKLRDQLPAELLPKLLNVIDDLASNPDAYPLRLQSLGKDESGELIKYINPDLPVEITYQIDRTNHKIRFIHFANRIVVLKRVFVSYSHDDDKWLAELKKFLKPLVDRGLLNTWDDKKILAGSDWQIEIEKALQSASMAIFLVSQSFLASDFIAHQELPPLLEKAKSQGLTIIWIAVSASTVRDSVLSQFQAANDPENPLDAIPKPERNKVLVKIYDQVMKAAAI